MKAISVWQPWATLLAAGAKRIETRSWSTSYRGPLLIHAAKRSTRYMWWWAIRQPFVTALAACGHPEPRVLPLGQLVGIVALIDCVPTENIEPWLSPQERAFGDYDLSRWAWITMAHYQFREGIPWRGRQRLFDADIDERRVWEVVGMQGGIGGGSKGEIDDSGHIDYTRPLTAGTDE